ncbi:MAG TPA: serine/threonine-protein kinase, partial [Candidatus Obscuribacterales bacterium]
MGNEHAPNKAAGTDGSATQEDNGDEAEKDADGTTERPAASTGARQNASDLEQTCDFGLQEVFQPGATVLDKYRVIELIASGGVGSVYRVQHLPIGSDFALKCLNRCQPDEALWRRFQNETRAAQKLDHQHFTKVHEFGLLPSGRPYFVMDLVRGITLSDEIKKLGVLPISRAVKIFIQVGFAISYAHDNGIIHRDIKPSNIMLIDVADHSTNDFVRVVDLGIAKLTGQDEFNQQTLTKTGEIFGSPLYMSPEQCKGLGVDHRSDLYSLGCVMYEALTGAPPLIGDTALATMMKHQSEKPLTLQEASLGRKFPPLLEMIVEKLLEKDREKRYQTAKALVA